jgi:hypothetical protein
MTGDAAGENASPTADGGTILHRHNSKGNIYCHILSNLT